VTDSARQRRELRPMNIYVMRGSSAEHKYRAAAGVPLLEPEVIAPGIPPTPAHDLLFHGGKTIHSLTFANLYVAGSTWNPSDVHNIDRALSAAMADVNLNNVMAQYFGGTPPTSTFASSQALPGSPPPVVSQGDVEQLVTTLQSERRLPASTSARPSSISCCPEARSSTTIPHPAPGAVRRTCPNGAGFRTKRRRTPFTASEAIMAPSTSVPRRSTTRWASTRKTVAARSTASRSSINPGRTWSPPSITN